jgi:hypothetical protein
MKTFRLPVLLVAGFLLALLAGCASVVKVEGEQNIQSRMTVRLGQAWNKVGAPGNEQPYEAWTQEGLNLDHLRLWAGVRSGQSLVRAAPAAAGQRALRVPVFRAGMAPDQLANLFEVLYSADGSQVQVTRLEPSAFVGEQGVRFELSIIRKRDDVQMSAVGWVAVRGDELFAITYVAPRLGFFPRGRPGVEAIATSARLR